MNNLSRRGLQMTSPVGPLVRVVRVFIDDRRLAPADCYLIRDKGGRGNCLTFAPRRRFW